MRPAVIQASISRREPTPACASTFCNLSPTFSVEELASAVNMSRSNLFRKLKSLTGQSPLEFIFSMRLKKSLELLLHRKMNVSEIAFEVGFKNPSSFTKAFKKQFGKSPSLFLKEITDKELINERD
jgi:AraC-like DNA-binding protein